MKNSYARYLGIGPKLCQAGLAPAGDELCERFPAIADVRVSRQAVRLEQLPAAVEDKQLPRLDRVHCASWSQFIETDSRLFPASRESRLRQH